MTYSLDLGLNVLDHQLIDGEGRRCGKVDEIALEGGPGEELVVTALLAGPDLWPGRAPWLGRLAAWIARGGRQRIAWGEVDRVRSHVELKRTAAELGLGRGDDRLRLLVERIPGADK